MVMPKIHQRFLKLFGAKFFKQEKMANIMKSTRQNTFTPKRTLLSVAAVLAFILLIFPDPVFSAACQYKIVRVTDGDTIKVKNNGKGSIAHVVEVDALDTSKKKSASMQILTKT
jgi:hypothetical protein